MIEAHSEDYTGPPFGDNIGRFGLCYRCHLMVHCRFKAPRAFALYVETLARLTWPPLTRNFPAIQAMIASEPAIRFDLGRPGWTLHEVGDPSLLTRMAVGEFRPA